MTSSVLKHQHTSLQFSDTNNQQVADVEKLFAKGKLFPIKSGTEAGFDTATHKALVECAADYGHAIKFGRSNFVAVDKKIVKRGSLVKDSVFVVSNDHLTGHQHDRDFPTIVFTHTDPRMGRIAVAGFHYSTKGRRPGDPNYDTNKLYARKIEEWMRRASSRGAIALGAGDFNMVDSLKSQDWAFGGEFTSMADELGKYKNTGHGPIDGFVSYDRNRRVKAKKFEVLTDADLHLFTDHYMCRGTWTVRHLTTP